MSRGVVPWGRRIAPPPGKGDEDLEKRLQAAAKAADERRQKEEAEKRRQAWEEERRQEELRLKAEEEEFRRVEDEKRRRKELERRMAEEPRDAPRRKRRRRRGDLKYDPEDFMMDAPPPTAADFLEEDEENQDQKEAGDESSSSEYSGEGDICPRASRKTAAQRNAMPQANGPVVVGVETGKWVTTLREPAIPESAVHGAAGASRPSAETAKPSENGQAAIPESVKGLLQDKNGLVQEVMKIKHSLESASQRVLTQAVGGEELGDEDTQLHLKPKVYESWLHADNKAKFFSFTGLEAVGLNDKSSVVVRGTKEKRLHAIQALRRLMFHCQWGYSTTKVDELLSAPKPVQTMVIRLSAVSSKLESHESRLTNKNSKLRIGSSQADCQVFVDPQSGVELSRKHCTITFEPQKGECYVQDMSTNGTYLNGRRLPHPPFENVQDARVRLAHGDEISFREKSAAEDDLGYMVNLQKLD